MRVTAFVPLYPPRSQVGAWLSTHECLAELVRRGHSARVYVLRDPAAERWTIDGVEAGPVPRSDVELQVVVARSDVVVTHCGAVGKADRLAARHGRPVVRMAHGRIDDRESLAGADLVVWNSATLRASAPWWDGPSIVVHPPTFPDRYRTEPGDRVTLVNLSAEKGGRLFWRLAEHLADRRFLGVTGGYGRQERGPRLGNVEVIPTTRNMRDDVYRRTRVLLMPSDRETWGMTGVEAMCSGIPVIAHPTPGLVESLAGAGIFVDRRDAPGWAAALERLDDPTEYASASAAARARVAELDPHLDLARFAEAVEALDPAGVRSCA